MKRALLLCCTLLLHAAPRLSAQERGAASLGELVRGLGTTGRVLVIGAHPDDEDTQLIAWLATGRHVETAYLSLTRGDGGQNLIGNELGETLGMIRTEELLAARRIDGGRQYFTRAFDFGFSKNAEETFKHWPHDSILKDVVTIVRAYRPQVIVSIWTGTPADGHGHHQASGILAREAFDAAADSVRFPTASTRGLPPWTPLKFYRARGYYREGATLWFNVGEYDPLLGHSYSEIATRSRSQHRSQGQGALENKGVRMDAVKLEVSRVSNVANATKERGFFDGIDTSWARFQALPLAAPYRAALDSLVGAQRDVDSSIRLYEPSVMVKPLARYVGLLNRLASGLHCAPLPPDDPSPLPVCRGEWGDLANSLATIRRRATQALLDAAGVDVEATAPRELIAEGDSMPVTVSVYDRGPLQIEVDDAGFPARGFVMGNSHIVPSDSTYRTTLMYHAPREPTLSWWIRRPRTGDVFDLDEASELVVGEDAARTSAVDLPMSVGGVHFTLPVTPIVYRLANPARGEEQRPIATVPEIAVVLPDEVEYARANAPLDRMITVSIRSAATGPRDVDVRLTLPAGLRADTPGRRVSLPPFGAANVTFRVRGTPAPGRYAIAATAVTHGEQFHLGYLPIEYEHIRPLRYFRAAETQLQAVDVAYASTLRVGYVPGVGDNVAPMLEELGIPVTMLNATALAQTNLSRFSTIVIGPRAFAANDALVATNSAIMEFARKGGTVVTQYGRDEMTRPGTLPYPITMTRQPDRVTEEDAPVRMLRPGAPILTRPNRIGDADFDGWVQERATFMPHTFDSRYRTVLSMNDTGEPPTEASILVAPVGRGVYIYTTLSFFRQLPAGNPGAARLFVNLLSAKSDAVPATTATR